jgi:hypothetical protein
MKTYEVKPLTDFLTEYKDKHRIILRAIQQLGTEIPISERMRIYEEEVGKLKIEFSIIRKAEYESKSIELSVEHSCTSKSSGGKKDCKEKCVYAPVPGLYTTKKWIRVVVSEGESKGVTVFDDKACIRMSVAGKGRNAATLYATFYYMPSFIASNVEKDVIQLFNLVSSSDINLLNS